MIMYAQRLSNLSQTELGPLLPLPVIAEPQDDLQGECIVPHPSHDPAVLEEVVALLQACDKAPLVPILNRAADENAVQVSQLQQAVLSLDPNAFATERISQPVSPPAVCENTTFPGRDTEHTESQSAVDSHFENEEVIKAAPVRRKRQRRQTEEVSRIDSVEVLNQGLQDYLAKQHTSGHESTEADSQALAAEDVNDSQHTQQAALEDLQALNAGLSKMAQKEIHLLDPAHLLELLGVLEGHMQRGGTLLIDHGQKDDLAHQDTILLSLEACVASLHILAAPDMPKQVYQEELIDRLVALVKFHLVNNVLVFYDASICQANRPNLLDPDDEWNDEGPAASKRKGAKAKRAPSLRVPTTARAIQGRLEEVLHLTGALLGYVQLQASSLLPLLRSACQSLSVEGVDLLQVKAAGLLVSVFQNSPQLQSHLLEELVSKVLPSLPGGKRWHKAYVVGSSRSASVQVITAMLIQMIQACVHLPASPEADEELEQSRLRDCFALAVARSDEFWNSCFDRFPTAKASKSDADMDIKQIVEHVVLDLVQVLSLPAWPAASTLLLRCINTLGGPKGLQHSDSSVKQISVDLLGLITAHLHRLVLLAESNQEWLAQLSSAGDKTPDDSYRVLQHLLLDHLADHYQQKDAALAESARSFLVCRMLADEICGNQADTSPDPSQLLHQYHRLQQQAEVGTTSDLASEEAANVALAVVHQGPLGRGCSTVLAWLLDAAGCTKQVPTTRAKAVKALGLVAEIDPSLLAHSKVQAGINKALQDESVSVREAAVDLLGKHISARQDLAMTYFDILATAVRDLGTSVRKRAINIMWESCAQTPGFQRATDACVLILGRITDPEESIQKLVGKFFQNLWFSSGASHTGVTLEARAQQLGEVAVAVYEAFGPAIHLPLEPSHALLRVIKQALTKEGDSSTGPKLAAALLDHVLQAVDAAQGPQEADSFPHLLALHAFCSADVTLCMPRNDPGRFLRCLAPYLKVPPSDGSAPKERRRGAERLLCILAVLTALLGRLDRLSEESAQELATDLIQLINAHHFVQVVAAAAQSLCALGRLLPSAAACFTSRLHCYTTKLDEFSVKLESPGASESQIQSNVAHTCRFIYIVGQLVRYGADILQANSTDSDSVDLQQLRSTLVSFYMLKPGILKLKEKALEGLGFLFIAQPTALMEPSAAAAMRSALRSSSAACLKLKALGNLLELLKSEEEGLQNKQDEATNAQNPAGQEATGLIVPVQNGEGDSLNLSAGFIQDNWEAIKALALDTTPPQQPLPSTPSHDPNQSAAQVRRRALEVMEAVLRGGVMPPFSAVPTLFALATDPVRDIANRALQVVQREAQRHSAVRSQLTGLEGIQAAAVFQEGLREPHSPGQTPQSGVSEDSARGMAALYSHVLQPDRNIRVPFLKAVLRCFDIASDLLTLGAATANLRLLLFCTHMLSSLPYKRCDEVCTVLQCANGIIARRGAFVLSAMKAAVEASPPSEAPAEPEARHDAQTEVTPDADSADQEEPVQAPAQPVKVDKAGPEASCSASLSLSMLLMLKRFLQKAYSMSDERITAFSSDLSDKRKQEERMPASRLEGMELQLNQMPLDAQHDANLCRELYKALKALLQHDPTDYSQGPFLARSNSRKRAKPDPEALQDAAALDDGSKQAVLPAERYTDADTPAWANAATDANTAPSRQLSTGAKGRSLKGQRSVKGRGSRDAVPKSRATTNARKKRKAVQYSDSQDIDGDLEEDAEDNDDEEFVAPGSKVKAIPRKRLESML